MKRVSAWMYYLVLVAVPVILLLTLMGVKTGQVQGGDQPEDWWTICHYLGGELWEYEPFYVDRNTLMGQEKWDDHQEHDADKFYEGKFVACPGTEQPSLTPTQTPTPSGMPSLTPTPSVSMTPLPTQTPQPTVQPTLTPVPTQPPFATATPKPEENKKNMDISKHGPTCEERTFSVSVQLKDDGKEIKDVKVNFSYLNQTKSATTNDQGRAEADLDYAGKGEVRAEAEGWPTARVTVDELICDGTVLGTADGGGQGGVSGQSQGENGKILGYANTGVNTEAMILLIQSVGLLMIVGGSVAVVKA